ncbi:phosphoribosyltransferase [Achromobacter mucicolens]|uniref:phosphoribosyltransferase n=1 Tax=Achromobacter mucicolens TaxID=1389922 RepID=UPI0024469D9C|nr:phosphoribosyltransferase [Achromobacter mucicolens]MDH0091777.1 phosphoribosyltransferase [Achromobacter mucicolens]
MNILFRNRREAGLLLARKLASYAGRPDVIVLALPRGGVPVGFEVAAELNAPLDIMVVRKIGMPGHPEYAIGAISSDQSLFQTREIEAYGVDAKAIESIVSRERKEIARRESLYRAGRPPLALQGKVVIVVDDGFATGSTMRVALQSVRKNNPAWVVAAVPVAAAEIRQALEGEADEVACLHTPTPFYGVGQWYADFEQTADDEVLHLLHEAQRRHPSIASTTTSSSRNG